MQDNTPYVYDNLSLDDHQHGKFEDVRSVGMALANVAQDGFEHWLGHSLFSAYIQDRAGYSAMLARGLDELGHLHRAYQLT
ncbi:hypothetical protein D3C85_1463560 [compost metagenome]